MLGVGTIDTSGKFVPFERETLIGMIRPNAVDFKGESNRIKGVWMANKRLGGQTKAHLLLLTTGYLFTMVDMPKAAPVSFFMSVQSLPDGGRANYVLK